jgi:Domain of unknown function (DUF4263)
LRQLEPGGRQPIQRLQVVARDNRPVIFESVWRTHPQRELSCVDYGSPSLTHVIRPARRPHHEERHLDPAEGRAAINRMRELLDARAPEEAIHQLLANHIEFWNGIVRLVGGCPLYTKISLGGDYTIDFAYVDMSSNGAEWHFVEIEPPSFRLFTKAGDPSHRLTHALRQVRDWQHWVAVNTSFARKRFPGIVAPMGHVFMGRRAELATIESRDRLHALNIEYRGHVEIHTLDRFLTMAESAIGFGPIGIPTKALTDADLRKGLPRGLKQWINSDFGSMTLFLDERIERDVFDEDPPPSRR